MTTKTQPTPAAKTNHTGPIDWRRLVEWLHADGVISDEEAKRTIARCAQAESVQRLRQDIASLVTSLPPDPRNGPVAVRAARFEVQGDTLAYNVVLSRERAGANPFGGVMQLVVAGASGRAADTVALAPVPVSLGLYDTVRGSLPLPRGFTCHDLSVTFTARTSSSLGPVRIAPDRS